MITSRFGRFRIKEWLGGGRFADVYLAEDTLLKKDFALKIARAKEGDAQLLLKEIKLLSELLHPNIVRFYTVEIFEGRIGIVLEYIKGRTLRDFIKENAPLGLASVLDIIKQICDAVEYAHSKGVLHRDLKPENIMLTEKGQVKITDFGLAFFMEGELTRSIAGTPPYMAPEAWKGKFYKESDIFSIGVILYELLTGINPFFADNLEEISKKIKKGIKARDIPAELDEQVKETLMKALSPDPQERFHSAREFYDSLTGTVDQRTEVVVMSFKKGRKRKIALTEEQLAAVRSESRYTLVVGGPGTGKTQTLVGRLFYLLDEQEISPERILITTFTIKGWEDLESRITRVDRAVSKDLWIGNFHNICYRMISPHVKLFGYPQEFSIITPAMQLKLVSELMRRHRLNYDAMDVKNIISLAKGSLMTPEEVASRFPRGDIIAGIWSAYDAALKESGYMDYDDILLFAYRLLKENEMVGQQFSQLFQHVIVDEFQDLNRVQFEIIKLLLRSGAHLFATGDDDQSIYEWRGSNPDLVRNFQMFFPEDSVIYTLTRSFRLPQEIMKAAQNLISYNRKRVNKVLWTEREDKGSLVINSFETRKDQAEFVATVIKTEVERGRSYNDFAVIYRSNYQSRVFEQVFSRHSIPYSVMFTKSFIKRREIDAILTFLKLIERPSLQALIKILNFGKTLVNRRQLSRLKQDGDTPFDQLMRLKNEEVKKKVHFLQQLHQQHRSLLPSQVIKIAVDFLGLNKAEDISRERLLTRLENINELLEVAVEFEERSMDRSVKAFLNYVKTLFSSGVLKDEESVKLLSAHASKGLEFPIVFLVDMYEGCFPLTKLLVRPELIEEERRLCFVALTRATERAYVCYPLRTTSSSTIVSRFVKEMIGV